MIFGPHSKERERSGGKSICPASSSCFTSEGLQRAAAGAGNGSYCGGRCLRQVLPQPLPTERHERGLPPHQHSWIHFCLTLGLGPVMDGVCVVNKGSPHSWAWETCSSHTSRGGHVGCSAGKNEGWKGRCSSQLQVHKSHSNISVTSGSLPSDRGPGKWRKLS